MSEDVVRRVVEVVDLQQLLDLGDAGVREDDLALLLLDEVVLFAFEAGDDAGDGGVERGGLLRRAADDERRPRLIDEDVVHLVDNGVTEGALDLGVE